MKASLIVSVALALVTTKPVLSQEPASTVASSDPKFGLYNAVADELNFDEVEAADARSYYPYKVHGYCSPWGDGGGDLCRSLDNQSKPICSNVNSKYYHNDCDRACIEAKCSSSSLCKGYTWKKSTKKGKLKSSIGGIWFDPMQATKQSLQSEPQGYSRT